MTDRHAAAGAENVLPDAALAGDASAAVPGVGIRPAPDIVPDTVPPSRLIPARCRVPDRVRSRADAASAAES